MDSLLTPEAAAARISIKPRKLADLRRQGQGPRYIRLGRKTIRYRQADLTRWLERRLSK